MQPIFQETFNYGMNREALVTELTSKFNLKQEQAENLAQFLEGEDELDPAVEEVVYSHYMDLGEMPYGVAKARDGDPQEWIFNELNKEYDL